MALNGIDISHYQSGIDLTRVHSDFVIQKATQGTNYVDPTCDKHYQIAKGAGILRGVYHFANGLDANAEADFFLKNVKGYVGDAILILDWEASAVNKGASWVEAFCKRVISEAGVKPWIYGSLSPLQAHGIPALAAKLDCGLWVAKYGSNPVQGYSKPAAPIPCTCLQFTSMGSLPNWSGRLDLNVFYGDAVAWKAYASTGMATVPSPSVNNPYAGYKLGALLKTDKDKKGNIIVGSTGQAVVMLQNALKWRGYDIGSSGADGKYGKDTANAVGRLQTFAGIKSDKIVGEDTCKALGWIWLGK